MTQPPVEPLGDDDPASPLGAGSPDDLPDAIEPTEADVDAWLAKLSPAEREGVFEGGYAEDYENGVGGGVRAQRLR